MAILNYSTVINASRTVGEIQELLAKKGADRIITNYKDGLISSVSFVVSVYGNSIMFELPANWQGVKSALATSKAPKTDEHAMNVCWRIIKDWIAAQMALIEAGQSDLVTVFLPYAILREGGTVAQKLLSNPKQFLLNQG